jgi:hypothetical protein
MGKIVSQIDFSEFTPDKYNNTLRDLESAGQGHPKGRLYHVAIQKDKGMLVMGLWESEKDFIDFSNTLAPILEKNGIKQPKPAMFPVFNYLH